MFDWNEQKWKQVSGKMHCSQNSSIATNFQTPSMLIERETPACLGLGDGRIMVAGGVTEFAVEVYDPVTESWSFIADLPIGRDGGDLILHKGEVLLVGGYSFDVSQFPKYITRFIIQ